MADGMGSLLPRERQFLGRRHAAADEVVLAIDREDLVDQQASRAVRTIGNEVGIKRHAAHVSHAMSNSKLYQPPPPPPKQKDAAVDPLVALSKAPTVIAAAAEELTDLTDDEGLEEWAKGGTRVMPKPQRESSSSTPPPSHHVQPAPMAVQPTMMSAPLPSFHPVAYAPPRIVEKRSAAIWLVPLALFVFAGGVVAAAAGWYVYHTNDLASSSATATDDHTSNASDPPPPAVTLTTTTTTTIAAPEPTVTATAATAATTATSTSTGSVFSKRSALPTTTTTIAPNAGSIRTFAAGNGKPIYVDGKLVGYGGAKLATVCGRHLVGVGTSHAKSVDIPCNGATITVGSPDGT